MSLPVEERRSAVGDAARRLGVPDIRERTAWEALDREAVAAVLGEAEKDRAQPWPHTLLSDYARYWRDGVRVACEEPVGELRRRTSAAVAAAAITGDESWLDQAADGLQLLCEQTTWCWAAHESFATARNEVVPDPDDPYVDLGAAETVEVLAWADLVLGPALDDRVPGLRRRLRREARVRVFVPFLQHRDWHWLGLDGRLHNWNPWIHGHILSAALLLEPDLDVRLRLVDLVVEGLSRYLAAMPSDGGCDEGYAYWWNGPARLATALELLDRITGSAFDPWGVPPLTELARYPGRMALGDGWYVNIGDGPARPNARQPWHVLHRWGRRIGDDDVTTFAATHRDELPAPQAGLGRLVQALFDPDWWAAKPGATGLPRSTWLPDTQVFVARDPGAGLTLAAKGGHNDENHNHNDVGSIIVAVDSSPVLIDLGQPTYTAISFSPRRYEQWVVRSIWHNVPLVDGQEQSAGADSKATQIDVQEGKELALTLPDGAVRRKAVLDAGAVRVLDTWPAGHEVVEHFVIAGTPQRRQPGELVVRALSGAVVTLTWDEELGEGTLERRPLDDELLSGVWGPEVHRLAIDASARTTFELSVRKTG